MKKYLFLLVAVVSLALSSGQAYAQRYLPKMKGVELRGGFVNGSKSPLNYYTGIAMSDIPRRLTAGWWVQSICSRTTTIGVHPFRVPSSLPRAVTT